MSITHRVKRLLGISMVGAMVLALMPAGFAAASEHTIQTDDVEACEGSEGLVEFNDTLGFFESEIECMAAFGITVGDAEGNYNTTSTVTRQQMALFIARSIAQAQTGTTEIPESTDDAFDDIANINPEEARDAINWLADLEITTGVTEDTYDPSGSVTRQQMASFIARAHVHLEVDLPDPSDDDVFTDTDSIADVHAENVLTLHAAGVVEGTADGSYSPAAAVTRGQMSAFIVRSIGVLEAQDLWNGVFIVAPPTNQAFTVTPSTTQVVDTEGDEDFVEYTASGLEPGEEYEIALFPAGDVQADASVKIDGERFPTRTGGGNAAEGEVTFRDQDLDDLADDAGSTMVGEAYIQVPVFGGPADDVQVTAEADSNGQIQFRVVVDEAEFDAAVPVIWLDSEDDGASEGALDLDGDSTNSWNVPAEDFAVGGAAVFHQGEAPAGTENTSTDDIYYIDTEQQFFLVASGDGYGHQFFWGQEGDRYQYCSNACGLINEERFSDFLSIGTGWVIEDWMLGAGYDPEGFNDWMIASDGFAGTPTAVAAELDVDSDDEPIVRVSWDYPDPVEGNISQFRVRVYDLDDLSSTDYFTDPVVNLSRTGPASELEFDQSDLDADTEYVIRVTSVVGGTMMDSSLLSNVIEVEGPPAATIVSAELDEDAVPLTIATEDDVWIITFSDEMDADLADDAIFDVQDGDGNIARVSCAETDDTTANVTWASCTLDDDDNDGPDDSVLTITLEEDAIDRTPGDDDLTYPLTIINAIDVVDANGNDVNLEDSDDLVIN